jgi:hypothetical protein
MKTYISRKNLFIVIGLLCAAVVITTAVSGTAEAKQRHSSSQNNSRCSHTCGPYTIVKGGYTYSTSVSASYFCRLGWPSWGCGLLHDEAVARISPTLLSSSWAEGCGNIHSFSGRIVSVPPTPNNPGFIPGSGLPGSNFNSSSTSSDSFNSECTPGVDCPETDLGKIITNAELKPSIANARDNKCPFYWVTGAEDTDRKITCKLVINGQVTDLPKQQPDPVNGYLVPVGESSFVCTRGGSATTTETKILKCSGNPNVIEH